MDDRIGITIPFAGASLADHRSWFADLVSAGYTDVWSGEAEGADAFTPLALASAWEPALRLGVGIASAFTRGPALLAQQVATLADAAPGRFAFGLGTSTQVVVERWNGLSFDKPYQRARDILRFLRVAFQGEKVDVDYETFSVHGFRLSRVPEEAPPLLLAALRPGMLRLAGREADGAVLNWLSADDVTASLTEVHVGASRREHAAARPLDVVARIFVVPEPDPAVARAVARRMIAAYLNVPAYAAFHRWLGRGPLLKGMWEAWSAGDRRRALQAIPDEVVDALVVHGDLDDCRKHVARYVENGVTIPVLSVTTAGSDLRRAVLELAG